MGGARRYDIRINLLSLCLECHTAFHNGGISREVLLEIVAIRERRTVESITEEIYRLRRERK